MIFPKNQPIIFEPYLPNECSCNTNDFRLLAQLNDVCQFQVKVAPCAGTENSLCNPMFSPAEFTCNNWIVAGGFSMDTNEACCDAATGTIQQFESLVIGTIYQCQINISSILGTLYVYNGLTEVAQIQTTGITTFTFTAVSQDIMMEILDSDHSVCIGSIAVYALSTNMGFGIINSGGATVSVVDIVNSPEYFTFAKDTVTIKFTWSDFDVQEGQCYTIGFSEGCTNTNGQFGIFNQSFDSCLTGWAIEPGTIPSITCEQLENPETGDVENCIEFDNTGTGNINSFVTDLKVGLQYTIVIAAMSTDADGFLRIYTGTTFYDFTVSGESNGQTCTVNGVFKIEAHLQTSTFIRLWGVTVTLSNINDLEFDYESHPFKVGTFDCSHIVNLSNNDDGLGFVFDGSNFAPQIRLESVIHNSVPETIRKTYHDNVGKKSVYYGEFRNAVILDIDYVPTWVFNFLCCCFIADHFFVDGVEYFIEGEKPEPQYPERVCYDNMTPYQMVISEKTQMVRNANIGNEEIALSYGAQQVLTDSEGNEIVDLFTGSAIDIPL